MSVWLQKIADTIEKQTGDKLTLEDMKKFEVGGYEVSEDWESGDKKALISNNNRLVRLHKGLDDSRVPERGRIQEIVAATGYSKPRVSQILTGKADIPERFLSAVCRAFGINKAYVDFGDRWKELSPRFQTCIGDIDFQKQEEEALDAPMQEIVKEMKRLSEPNRWVFVGRAKAIIQDLLQEQG